MERAEAPWRKQGPVLLISCYEFGHQPLSVASPLAFLEQAGYRPSAIDIAGSASTPSRVGALDDQVPAQLAPASPRELPTAHVHEAPLGRPANNRLIHRRSCPRPTHRGSTTR